MMRDIHFKHNMMAGRPGPTRQFSQKVSSTLAKLPARKAPLLTALPVSAIVFVAVAALCIVAVNNKTVASLLAGRPSPAGQQFAAGDATSSSETAFTVQETPEPTPAAQTTSLPVDQETYLQVINESKTINNITETILEAGSDGFVLYVKVEFGPIPEGVTPRNDFSAKINGKKHKGGSFEWVNPVEGKKGYYTTITKMPLLDIGNQKLNISLSSQIKDNTYEMTSEKWKDSILAEYNFDLALTNWKPNKSNATGSGLFLYGNNAQIMGYYQSPQDTILCLTIDNDMNNKLATYFNKYLQERGNGEDTVIFEGEYPTVLNMFIYSGYTDESILDTLYTPVEGAAAHEAFDALNGKMFIKYINMLLKRNDNGTFTLYIISMNLRPASELTLISSYYTCLEDFSSPPTANAINYAMHVQLD